MRGDEVKRRIKEALMVGQGDPQAAIRTLVGWCSTDERLLRALVEPYLQGILFQHVKKAMGGEPVEPSATRSATVTEIRRPDTKPDTKPARAHAALPELPKSTLDAIIDTLGSNIPAAPRPKNEAIANPRSPEDIIANLGRSPEPPPPPKAGSRHQESIAAVARSFKQVDWKK